MARTQGGEVGRCLKGFAKGREPSAASCIATDARQKVAKIRAAVARAASRRCAAAPDFGPMSAAAVADAGAAAAAGVVASLFGDLDAGIGHEGDDRTRSRCQQSIAKLARKCLEVRLGEFNRCKKAGLKDGSIKSSGDLVACLGADPKGKIARACDRMDASEPDAVRAGLADACVEQGVSLGTALPGCSLATDLESAHACVAEAAVCRACAALVAADGLPVDCDERDDGRRNGSCPDASQPLATRR